MGMYLINLHLTGVHLMGVQPRNDTAMGAHCGRADQGARNGPAQPESMGRADGGGRGRVRGGEHG